MKRMLKILKENFGVLLFFILVSFYATYPLIFKLNSSFYGTSTDPLSWIWTFWWQKYAYLNKLSPEFISIIAYPFGMASSPVSSVWAVFNTGITILMGEVITYNIQILLNFFLAGIAMFCLIFYFTKNRLVSILMGLIFTLSPYHFARSWEHLSLSSVHCMVFYIYFLFVFTESRTYKSSFMCGLCFALIGQFSSYYYVYFMFIFTLLFFVFKCGFALFKKQKINLQEICRFVKLGIAGLSAIVLIMLPQIWRYINVLISNVSEAKATGLIRSIGQFFADSARPLNYFLPAEYHPIFGKITKIFIGTPLYGENSGGEQSLYLGIIPLALAFIGYKHWRKKKNSGTIDPNTDFLIRFWSFAFFVFMICSFSPYWGSESGFFIPFPSFFLHKIFPMFRNYARMGVLVMISVCVLAGFGLKEIIEGLGSNKKKLILVVVIGCGVLFEFLNIPPYRITDISKTPEVYNWLKDQPDNLVVADYPLEADRRKILFYQRVHKKNLVNGAIPETYGYEVMQKIISLEAKNTAGILRFLNTKYVLVHKDKYRNYEGGGVLGQVPKLVDNPGFNHFKDFGDTSVYEVIAAPIDPKTVNIEKEEFVSLAKQNFDLNRLNNMKFKFNSGDKFEYVLKYMGFIPAIYFDIELRESRPLEANKTMLIKASASVSHWLSYFFKAEAQLRSVFDINNFYNYEYEELTQIGKKVKEKKAVFDRQSNIMITKDRQVQIQSFTQDPISAIFYLSSQEMFPDKEIEVYINPGKSNYRLNLVVEKQEEISIDKQAYKSWKLTGSIVAVKDINKEIAEIALWFNRLDKQELIRIEAKTKAGLMTLEKQNNLDNGRNE